MTLLSLVHWGLVTAGLDSVAEAAVLAAVLVLSKLVAEIEADVIDPQADEKAWSNQCASEMPKGKRR